MYTRPVVTTLFGCCRCCAVHTMSSLSSITAAAGSRCRLWRTASKERILLTTSLPQYSASKRRGQTIATQTFVNVWPGFSVQKASSWKTRRREYLSALTFCVCLFSMDAATRRQLVQTLKTYLGNCHQPSSCWPPSSAASEAHWDTYKRGSLPI